MRARAHQPRPISLRLMMMLFAFLLGVAAIILNAAPWTSRADAWPAPVFLLIVVAWWRSARREDMPLGLVFVLGLAQDMTANGLIGPTLIPLMIVSALPTDAIDPAAPAARLMRWLAFAVLSAGYFAISWALWVLWASTQPYNFATPESLLAGKQLLSTALVYPWAAALLRRLFGVRRRERRR